MTTIIINFPNEKEMSNEQLIAHRKQICRDIAKYENELIDLKKNQNGDTKVIFRYAGVDPNEYIYCKNIERLKVITQEIESRIENGSWLFEKDD